ncbi:MAG: hypothetical protein Kow00124_30460 [Anaerolineae bacterium]
MTFVEVISDIFGAIHFGLSTLLQGWGLSEVWSEVIIKFLGAGALATFVLVNLIFTIWFERKAMGRIQDRIGPNRVGPWGIFQTVADLGKLLTKEIIIPDGADRFSFMIAPVIAVLSVVMVWGVLPLSPTTVGSDLNIGILYLIAVSSLGVMAVLLAGWSSNNKYALLGAFRAVAMLVSYEVPMVLTLLVPVLLAGSLNVGDIVEAQPIAFFFMVPLVALVFWIANVAEVGRQPFDLLEAESEIVAGYNIEYSGFAFAMFYAAEWAHGFTICAIMAVMFFGGWRGPFAEQAPTLGVLYLGIKTGLIYFFQVWTRATLPRLRIDQVMSFCWKALVPLSLVLLVLIVLVDKVAALYIPNYLSTESFFSALPRAGVLLMVNVLVGVGVMWLIAREGRRQREEQYRRAQAAAVIEPGTAQPIPAVEEAAGSAR